MPGLTDIMPALESFQAALLAGEIGVLPGQVDPSLGFYTDTMPGNRRFVFVRLNGQMVKAYVCLAPYERQEGLPIFAVGYAVPEAYRGQGYAKEVFAAAVAELRHHFAGNPPFFAEAIIDPGNVASLRVAAAVLGGEPRSITDQVSGQPALQYIRKFETLALK